MGKGSRPAKAKHLVLVPGTGGVGDDAQATVAIPVAAPEQFAGAGGAAPAPGQQEVAPVSPPPAEPSPALEPRPEVREPTLTELQALKEQIRHEHPDWYPEFRDTLGHQFNEQLVPQLAGLSAAELGLPEGTDPDRRRREVRALAFARSYLMAQGGDVEGLKAISPDLLYFWDDRLGGKLVPPPAISADDPAPWVHSINRLRSRHTDGMQAQYGSHSRFRRFVTAVKGWTDGRWRELRAASQRVLKGEATGKAELEAQELIEAIRAADTEAPRLWRKESARNVAERMGVSRDALLGHLQARVGEEVTQDIVSTSSRSDVWSGDFVWEVEPGAQAIHAYPISHYPSESEWITAGEFRLLAVEPSASGGVKVRVQQTGVFKEKE
jgi:hypothetical protein